MDKASFSNKLAASDHKSAALCRPINKADLDAGRFGDKFTGALGVFGDEVAFWQ
ncbi:MAG: hypothetical protein LBO03_05310 [Acidaminococcales bacterium]|nr:hypothetical protein [Acidaminococcales bacterium]